MYRQTRFESLRIWQQSRVLASEIYALTSRRDIRRDRGLSRRLRHASLSVLANIAEGLECGSNTVFRRRLDVAKAAAAQVRAQLYVLEDVYGAESATELRLRAAEIGTGIMALMRHLEDRDAPESQDQRLRPTV